MVRKKLTSQKNARTAKKQESSSISDSETRPSTSKSTMQTMSTNYRYYNANASPVATTANSNANVTVVREDQTYQGMSLKVYKHIRRLQASTNMLIPRLVFSRLVREIIMSISPRTDWRIQKEALQALQESCELYMTQYFEDAYLCTIHAKRQTLFINDMQLARRIRGRDDVINH